MSSDWASTIQPLLEAERRKGIAIGYEMGVQAMADWDPAAGYGPTPPNPYEQYK